MASLRVRPSVCWSAGRRDDVFNSECTDFVTRLCIREKKKSVITEENAERRQEVAFVAEKQMKRRRSPRFLSKCQPRLNRIAGKQVAAGPLQSCSPRSRLKGCHTRTANLCKYPAGFWLRRRKHSDLNLLPVRWRKTGSV